MRERLLRETELTLAEAVRICHASELAQQHAKTFSDNTKTSGGDSSSVAAVTGKMKQQKQNEMFNCKRCGKRHQPKQCPTYGKACAKCGGQKHFAKNNAFQRVNKREVGMSIQWKKLPSMTPSLLAWWNRWIHIKEVQRTLM